VAVFGLVGLVLGPVIAHVAVALLRAEEEIVRPTEHPGGPHVA
jgi:predicted PurR-regulated permease PerM